MLCEGDLGGPLLVTPEKDDGGRVPRTVSDEEPGQFPGVANGFIIHLYDDIILLQGTGSYLPALEIAAIRLSSAKISSGSQSFIR